MKKLTGSKEDSPESVLFRVASKSEEDAKKGSDEKVFVTPLHDAMELLSAERG